MATLRVAIDARAAKSGRDEYLRYTGDLSKATADVERNLDDFTKKLVEGFKNAGIASKKISPEILSTVQSILELKQASGGAKTSVDQLGKAFEAYRKIEAFNKDLKSAQEIVTGFDRAANGTIETVDRLGNSFEAMDLRARAAKGAYENLIDAQRDAEREAAKKSAENFAEKMDRDARVASASYKKLQDSIRDANRALADSKGAAPPGQSFGLGLQTATEKANTFFAEFGAGLPKIDKTIERIQRIEDAIRDANDAARQFSLNQPPAFGAGIDLKSPATQAFGAGINSPAPAFPTQKTSTKVFETAFSGELLKRQKEFVANTRTAEAEIERLGSVSGTTRSQISQLFLGFSAIFAIREGVGTVIGKLRDFSLAMSEVKAVTGATSEEFVELSQTAREVGVNSVFGATKSAEALRALAKAGFSAKETLQTLPTVLNFATVAGTNLDTSSDLLSKTLRQFRLDVSNAERAADALAITSNKTTTEVLPLSEALVNVGPIAADLNNSLEDTTALLGTLAERGIQGGSAGTKLKGVILSLISPSRQAQEAIQSLRDKTTGARLSLEQLNPAVRSVKEIFETLSNSTLSAAEAELIFQQRFAGAGLVLASGVDTTQKIVKANEELRGETKRVADEINNNLNGSIQRFNAAVEEASLAAGDSGLTGSLRGIVDFGRSVVLSLAGTSNHLDEISTGAKVTAGAITGLTYAAGALVSLKLIGFLAESRLGFVAYTKSIENARIAMASFNGVAAVGPTLAAIGPAAFAATAGITTIIAALVALKKETPDVTEENKKLLESYENLNKAAKDADESALVKNYIRQVKSIQDVIGTTEKLLETRKKGQSFQFPEIKEFEKIVNFSGIQEEYKKVEALFATPLKPNVGVDIAFSSQSISLLEKALEALKVKLLGAKEAAQGIQLSENFGDDLIEARTNLEKYLDTLEIEAKIAKETRGLDKDTAAARAEIIKVTHKIAEKAIGAEKDRVDELIAKYTEFVTAAQKVKSEQEALTQQLRDQAEASKLFKREFEELTNKVKLLDKVGDARKVEAEIIRFANIAKAEGRELSEAETAAIRKGTQALIDDEKAAKAVKKEKSALASLAKRAATAAAEEVAAQSRIISSAEDLVNKYKILADTINETEEAQDKASVLGRFDAKTKKSQADVIKILRNELSNYLDLINKGNNRAAVRSVQELVEKYELQAAALGKTEDQQRASIAAQELANVTRGKEIAGIEEYTKRLNDAVAALNDGESKGRQKQAETVVKNLEKELSYLSLTNDERERSIALDELERASAGQKIQDQENLTRKVEETIAALQTARKARQISDTIAGGFEEAFEAALTDVENFGEAAISIAREVSLEITRILLIRPLSQSLASGLYGAFAGAFGGGFGSGSGGGDFDGLGPTSGSAKGNVFNQGNIVPFARGGLVDRPTLFPMAGGKRGLMGEAGTEAIMPLKRDSSGRLGVSAQGGGNVTHIHHWNISTPDPNSFKKSMRQVQQDASRAVARRN